MSDDCTEPNRKACPRMCEDFCNKAEEAKSELPSSNGSESFMQNPDWVPNEISGAGPQPRDFATWDDWVFARRLWVANQMASQNAAMKDGATTA